MHRLYNLLVRLLAPAAFALVLARGFRDRAYWQALRERFGFGRALPAGPRIWLHAVSMGEVAAAAPLVRALRSSHPHHAIVLTTATPTGRARAHALFGAEVDVRYLPYDLPGAVRRFLNRTQPLAAMIMETELWPNLFTECAQRKVPLVLASARLSAKSVARYRRFSALFRNLFTENVVIAAQTSEDAARFAAIGARRERTHIVGNVKFDIAIDPAAIAAAKEFKEQLSGERLVWVAGSTHAGEEEQMLDAHAILCTEFPSALLILAPRHPNRFDAVAALLTRRGCRFVRRSAGAAIAPDAQILLADTVGELVMFYASAEAAFVGGSLAPIGGHNLLEPAALGVPVLAGPSEFNAPDIAALLSREGALHRAAGAPELAAALCRLFGDPAERQRVGALARAAVELNRGSVARLLRLVGPLATAADC
jgi:3-deoxy-D-manno-octulosonic-acid transferase